MMGKKLLALLLCGALLVTVLAACGAPEEKEVSAEQDSQPVETEKEPDTGDASLDNPGIRMVSGRRNCWWSALAPATMTADG